jgi:hypothetical protein
MSGARRAFSRRVGAALVVVALVGVASAVESQPLARGGSSSHLTIPFLANAARPADLDFQAGECDIDQTGRRMTCEFQQVFLTTADAAPQTCLITTSQYERTFERRSPTEWISEEGPAGMCGIMDVATLRDEGGVRWTLSMRKVATNPAAAPACRAVDGSTESLGWQNLRRRLPCTFVQPGRLGR